jgi:hypothetical protein
MTFCCILRGCICDVAVLRGCADVLRCLHDCTFALSKCRAPWLPFRTDVQRAVHFHIADRL